MLKKFINYLTNRKIVHRYKKLNQEIFEKKYQNSNSQILIEFNAFHSDHIILSYLANYLSENLNLKIVSFTILV